MQAPTTPANRNLPATLLFALYALAWIGAVVFVYTSRTVWAGESGSEVTYSMPVVPLAAGLVGTVLYWLGLSAVAVFDKERRRFFLRMLMFAVSLALVVSVAFLVAKAY